MKAWILAIVGLLIGFGAGWFGRGAPAPVPADAHETQLAELRRVLAATEAELEKLKAAPPAQEAPSPPTPAPVKAPKASAPAPSPQPQASGQLQVQLEESRLAQRAAEARIASLEPQLADARQTVESQRRSLARVEEDLASANRLVAALQAELKSKEQRSELAETSVADLRKRSQQYSDQLARLDRAADRLDDFHKRRNALLSQILRRYREVTDLYRAMALRINNAQEAVAPSSTDLGRIQNAITLAEEDLRQLQTLSVQQQRLEQELADARRR